MLPSLRIGSARHPGGIGWRADIYRYKSQTPHCTGLVPSDSNIRAMLHASRNSGPANAPISSPSDIASTATTAAVSSSCL